MASRFSPEETARRAAQQRSMEIIKQKTGQEFESFEEVEEKLEQQAAPLAEAVEETPQAPTEEVAPVEEDAHEINQYGENYYALNCELLPSKGAFYKEKIIYLRNFKVIEIKRLASINEKTAEKVTDDVLSACIKGITYDDILSQDKLAIMFFIRTNTFPDPEYKINFTCDLEIDNPEYNPEDPKSKEKIICGHPGKLHFTGNDLDINYLEDASPEAWTYVTSDGIDIHWAPFRVKDERAIQKNIKMATQELKDLGVEEANIDEELIINAIIIDKIGGEEFTTVEKYTFLTEEILPGDFINCINKISKSLEFGMDTNIKTTCESCGGPVSIPVMFSAEFFFPEYNPN